MSAGKPRRIKIRYQARGKRSRHLKSLDIAQYDSVVSMGLGLDRWLGAYKGPKPARQRLAVRKERRLKVRQQ